MPPKSAENKATVSLLVDEAIDNIDLFHKQLNALLNEWEYMAFVLDNGFYSVGAFCSDVCMRQDIDNMLQVLDKQMLSMPPDWVQRLSAADERFMAETADCERCIIDLWQEKLMLQGKELWGNWTLGQTNQLDHWYFYRQPT